MKLTHFSRLCGAAVLCGSAYLAFAPVSRADLVYYVTLNVATLTTNPNGPFSLDLALSSGADTPDSDNTVTISNLAFTGGSVGAATYSNGGESGSMSSSVVLTTSNFDNELAQSFSNTVTKITFSVDETSTTDNPYPDQFSVAILDAGLGNIQTTDPSGANTLVLSNLNTAETLASVATYNSTATGEAPGVTTSAVPEPGSVLGIVCGLGGLGFRAWRRARRGVVLA
jgi:hypothetical protein